MPNLSGMIKEIRNREKLSQERFGKKLGLSGKTISAYETGRLNPSLKFLEEISRKYDVSIFKEEIKRKEELKQKYRKQSSTIKSKINDLHRIIEELNSLIE